MKICSSCKELKDYSLFYKRGINSYQHKCKVCDRKYKIENADRQKECKRNHYLRNIEKIKTRSKLYKKNNRKRMREKLFKTRPDQKILHYTRTRLNTIIKNRTVRGSELFGCKGDFLVKYLESKFKVGMSWGNYGLRGWHIDHIIPCSRFDLTNEFELRQCFHYTNLQPLWANENILKSDNLTNDIQISMPL